MGQARCFGRLTGGGAGTQGLVFIARRSRRCGAAENALVLCVDEKPCIQGLERAQGWIRLPNGRAMTGFAHEYKRHGTTTLFAALEVATGLVHSGHYRRRRRREFLDFMNDPFGNAAPAAWLGQACPKQFDLHLITVLFIMRYP
jgi:hypothetical protein